MMLKKKKSPPRVSDITVKFLVDERSKNKHRVITLPSFLNEHKQTVNFSLNVSYMILLVQFTAGHLIVLHLTHRDVSNFY